MEIGTETPRFLFWEYLCRNFGILSLQCERRVFLVGSPVKKCVHCVIHQVNDASVRIRLVVFLSKVQLFYIEITEQTGGGEGQGREESGATPLTCCVGTWLTVIWSGAPTDSLGGGPRYLKFGPRSDLTNRGAVRPPKGSINVINNDFGSTFM